MKSFNRGLPPRVSQSGNEAKAGQEIVRGK